MIGTTLFNQKPLFPKKVKQAVSPHGNPMIDQAVVELSGSHTALAKANLSDMIKNHKRLLRASLLHLNTLIVALTAVSIHVADIFQADGESAGPDPVDGLEPKFFLKSVL